MDFLRASTEADQKLNLNLNLMHPSSVMVSPLGNTYLWTASINIQASLILRGGYVLKVARKGENHI